MYNTGDLQRVLLHLWAAGGTHARKTVTLKRHKIKGDVRLPAACSRAVHGCQLVLIRAAAPNLLQVRAGRHCAMPEGMD
jgi:hypothetical protein